MTEMIEAEPAVAERCLTRLLADPAAARLAAALREAATAGRPVTVVGCGTSEHGALGAGRDPARRLARRPGSPVRGRSRSRRSRRRSNPPRPAWRSGSATTVRPGRRRRPSRPPARPESTTAIVTVSGRAPGAEGVDIVVETLERDQSYCHTIGYTAPLVAAVALGRLLTGSRADPAARSDATLPGAIRALLAAGLAAPAVAAAERVASRARRQPPDPGHRLGRRPDRRPRARAQARGGHLDPVRLAQPRDVPPRAPAGDRRRHRARPRHDRSPGAVEPGRACPPGARGRRRHRAPERGHPVHGGRRRAGSRADPGRPDRGARRRPTCRRLSRRCWRPPSRSSSSSSGSPGSSARTPTRSAATTRPTGPRPPAPRADRGVRARRTSAESGRPSPGRSRGAPSCEPAVVPVRWSGPPPAVGRLACHPGAQATGPNRPPYVIDSRRSTAVRRLATG